jgi:hypothetical protein
MWFWFKKSWQARATWHLGLPCWKTWLKCRYYKKGRTIGWRISSLYITAFNVPWTSLSWVRPSWQIPGETITLPPPKRSDSYTHWSIKRSPPAGTHDVIVCFVRMNAFHANIDVNDNKKLFLFQHNNIFKKKKKNYRFFCWLVYFRYVSWFI